MRNKSKLPKVVRLATSVSLALASAGALTGALLFASAQAASATTVSGTVSYTCPITLNGATITTPVFQVQFSETVPSSVAPGGTVDLTDVQTTTTVPGSLVTLLVAATSASKFAGTLTTLDFNATGGTPATINAAGNATFSVPVKSNVAATIVLPATPETVGPFTAGSSGTLDIAPGNILIVSKFTLSGKAATADVTCSAPSSIPAAAIASIPIESGASTGTTVPTAHTGEPWAGWPYWVLIGLAGMAGLGSIERAARIRRRRA